MTRVLLAVLVLTACAAPPTDPVASTGPAPTVLAADEVDPARLEPLAAFGPCPAQQEVPDVDVPDVPLPPGTTVAVVADQGPLVQLQGYVAATPVQSMVALLDVEGWTTVQAEDEVFEAETLLTRGDERFYFKSQAVCDVGSAFVAFLGDGAPVPTPTGATP